MTQTEGVLQERDARPSVEPVVRTLPRPPLRLRRVFLRGVGPELARFDPLDLDFNTPDGAASRVLLSLTNTGGKSTLITLISSLIVPAARAQVGRKILGDYVLTGDTSHIVCEWEDATTNTRTVTGTVMEWKEGRRQPGHKQRSTTNMHRAWYLFRTGTDLPGIDDLPFVHDGRRTTLETYLAKLSTLMSDYPRSQWVLTRVQQEWTRALEDRTNVDPVLFGYQMRMNDAESGARNLLSAFDSPDNVVRFFIAALNDDREIADFTAKLAPYAELAERRPELEALAGFGAHISPRIDVIAERKSAVDEATATALRARVAGGEHAAAIHNRVAQDQQTLADLRQSAVAAEKEAATARREYGQISDIRLQLQLEQARYALSDAAATLEVRTKEAADAAANAAAWEAVDAVLDVQVATKERDAAKAAYDEADEGLGPLRERVRDAAGALAGRLEALVAEADAMAEAAADRVSAGQAAFDDALAEERDAERRRDGARRKLEAIDSKTAEAQSAREQAIAEGWLHPAEEPPRCLQRWTAAVAAAKNTAAEEEGKAAEEEAAFDQCAKDLGALGTELDDLRVEAERDKAQLDDFDADLSRLAADDTVLALLGDKPADASDARRAIDLANRAAAAADIRAADHERIAREAQEELSHLDESGTSPTGADVLTVLRVLLDARFGAVAGLEWIEHNVVDPESRPEFIEARPDIAGGVVVSDPRRFDDAIRELGRAAPRVRVPVNVTTPPTDAESDITGRVGQHHVVLPHRATWDRDWAAKIREELAGTVAREGAAASEARAAARCHRDASAACTTFVNRWGSTLRHELAAASSASAGALQAALQRRTSLLASQAQHRAAAQHARLRREQAVEDERRAARRVSAATKLTEVTSEAAAAAQTRPATEREAAQGQGQLDAATTARNEARTAITVGLQAAAQAKADRGAWQRERGTIGVDEAGPDPGGNLTVVRSSWSALRDELTTAEQGLVEAEFLKRAQSNLDKAKERSERFRPHVLAQAAELALSTEASSRESLTVTQQRAKTTAGEAELRRLRAEHDSDKAKTTVKDAAPGDRQNHIDLTSTPQWLPATPSDIPRLLELLEIHNGEVLARKETAEKEELDAKLLHEAVADDIATFNDTIDMWPADRMATSRVYTGAKDAARDLMRKMVATNRDGEANERTARDDLRDAIAALRTAADDQRWRTLDAPAAVRIRSLPESDLIAEAATLARRIRAMAESAAGDLASLDKHRTILRDGLFALCREQRRLLREITRASRLPDGLGEFSQQPAIKIRFEDASDDEATARLAGRIDTWAQEIAANPKRTSSAEVRARWLADAVRDTVIDRARAGPWSIEILKPRIDGRVMYCPSDRIPHEFSGGQELTLAVLVFCALSGVRSAHRPGGARPAGTLILDNPFGPASAEPLIAMQQGLAAHTGLQLVCATGLNDAGVDAAFTGPGSVIVKLRNDGDLRRNLSYLRLRSTVVDGIDIVKVINAGRDPADAQGWVDATTYEVRR